MTGIGLWLAGLLGLLLESIFYGLFLLLYLINLLVANGEATVPVPHQRMFYVSTLMLMFATTHLIVAFIRLVQGLQPGDGDQDLSAAGALYDISYKVKIALYFFQTILADGLMTWRCFVIFEKRWWILFPGSLTILLDITTLIIRLMPASEIPASPGSLGLIPLGCRIAFLSTTLILHLSGTLAIVLKIYLTRRSLPSAPRSLSPVIIAIIESALIYTAAVFLLLLCNLIGSNGQFVVMDTIVPLVGIVFCLIVIRIRFYLRVAPPPHVMVERDVSTNPWTLSAYSETTMDERHLYSTHSDI